MKANIPYIKLLCIGSVQAWDIEGCQLIQLNSDPRLWMIQCIGWSTTIAMCQFDSSKWNDHLVYIALQSITEYLELTSKPIPLNVRSFCQLFIYLFFFFSSLGAIASGGLPTWTLSNRNGFGLLPTAMIQVCNKDNWASLLPYRGTFACRKWYKK